MEAQTVDPVEGTVAFGSAKFGWAFTLTKFARTYAKQLKVDPSILIKKFWGDNYFDHSTKKWVTTDEGADGTKLKRGFVEFIIDPIIRLVTFIMEDKKEEVFKICEKQGIVLPNEEKELSGNNLMKKVF